MRQPPRSDGTYEAPGKMCVIRLAMSGAPDPNALWDYFRDMWLRKWGWNKVLAEPSMSRINIDTGIARMEVDNDDFLATAPDAKTLERLARPLIDAWDITFKN